MRPLLLAGLLAPLLAGCASDDMTRNQTSSAEMPEAPTVRLAMEGMT